MTRFEKLSEQFAQRNFELSRRFGNTDYTPQKLREFLKHVGNPQDHYRVLHVAGTVGKGSVSWLLAKAYERQGECVGLYTSPHLVHLGERIRINSTEISEEEFFDFYDKYEEDFHRYELSFFDILTAIAFLYFSQKKISLAVIETGLGGRLDSTNVVKSECAIICRIGFDHQHILGHTLAQIAWEKAGIIKEKSIVYSMRQEQEALKVIQQVAQEKRANFFIPNYSDSYDYRKTNRNFVESIFFLHEQKKIDLADVEIPGRFERLLSKYPLYFDSAHNAPGIKALAAILERDFYDIKINIVFNCLKERNPQELLEGLEKLKNIEYFYPPWEIAGGYSQQELENILLRKWEKMELSLLERKLFHKNEMVVFCGSMRLYAPLKKYVQEKLSLR
ncbi:MAG: Mur ligase family protein [Leptospiraceae bacterium]|nr:Mur ligase family protein [Leptospiraceae bacterium]MDW8305465.1 hypothetical protein [Leptospiraceae bacterium]